MRSGVKGPLGAGMTISGVPPAPPASTLARPSELCRAIGTVAGACSRGVGGPAGAGEALPGAPSDTGGDGAGEGSGGEAVEAGAAVELAPVATVGGGLALSASDDAAAV